MWVIVKQAAENRGVAERWADIDRDIQGNRLAYTTKEDKKTSKVIDRNRDTQRGKIEKR